ncbi:hypothetical protein C8R47DRAFT_1067293 [Mycena vitilis]|nr:hypothetical protein C8R47DRAFT_1067293 [Mycena vitilis]
MRTHQARLPYKFGTPSKLYYEHRLPLGAVTNRPRFGGATRLDNFEVMALAPQKKGCRLAQAQTPSKQVKSSRRISLPVPAVPAPVTILVPPPPKRHSAPPRNSLPDRLSALLVATTDRIAALDKDSEKIDKKGEMRTKSGGVPEIREAIEGARRFSAAALEEEDSDDGDGDDTPLSQLISVCKARQHPPVNNDPSPRPTHIHPAYLLPRRHTPWPISPQFLTELFNADAYDTAMDDFESEPDDAAELASYEDNRRPFLLLQASSSLMNLTAREPYRTALSESAGSTIAHASYEAASIASAGGVNGEIVVQTRTEAVSAEEHRQRGCDKQSNTMVHTSSRRGH